MKTIYNVYVPMESQEQCDKMKKLCVDYNLPYWDDIIGWMYLNNFKRVFCFEINSADFFCFNPEYLRNKTEVTEQEFIELLKNKENEKI